VKDSKIKDELEAIWRKEGVMPVAALVVSDPPEHAFHRSLVDKAFTPVRVRQMEAYLESIVDSMMDEFIDRGEVAFLSGMAIKVPLYVIADQLARGLGYLPPLGQHGHRAGPARQRRGRTGPHHAHAVRAAELHRCAGGSL
jgi:cytochrome P450